MAKAPTDIRSLARVHTDAAVKTLVGIMNQPDAPPPARVAAASALLDRGWGKPKQETELTVRRVTARELSDDALADIATGRGDGDIEPSIDPAKLN